MRRKQSSLKFEQSKKSERGNAKTALDKVALREELISYGMYAPHRADEETLLRMLRAAKKRMEKRKTKEYRQHMAFAMPFDKIPNDELYIV